MLPVLNGKVFTLNLLHPFTLPLIADESDETKLLRLAILNGDKEAIDRFLQVPITFLTHHL
jgi:hypothetical protein